MVPGWMLLTGLSWLPTAALSCSFLAPQASQAPPPTLIFHGEFILHYNRPYAKMATDRHLPLSGQNTLMKQDFSQNSCNVCFVVLQAYLLQHLIVKLSG